MEISLPFLLLGTLGFAAYEVGVRIIDNKTAWIKRIGIVRYLCYLVIFGGAVSVVAGGFSFSFIPSAPLAQAFAVVFGLGMPSSIRLFAEVVTKLIYEKAKIPLKTTVPGVAKPKPSAEQDQRTEHFRVDELKETVPKYAPIAYKIGDLFGFSSRL